MTHSKEMGLYIVQRPMASGPIPQRVIVIQRLVVKKWVSI